MSIGTLAKRYARAIYDLAAEAGEVERVGKDLADLAGMWESSDELRGLFANPGFGADARKQVLSELLDKAECCALAKNAALYINDGGRIAALPRIVEHYRRIAEEKAGALRAEVISAAPLPDGYYQSLQVALERSTGKKISLEKRTDPSLIGGVVTKVGGRVLDGSIKNRLGEIEDTLRSR